MKKQLAIAIVAILLTTGLIASPVMAFALWDGNSVQYSSHWSEGYNSITDKSVTASNQSIAIGNGIGERESSSRLKYYRAPVPVRTSNWPPIIKGTGIMEERGISGNSAYGIRGNTEYFANDIKNIPDSFPPIGKCDRCPNCPIKGNKSDGYILVFVLLEDGTRTLMKMDRRAFFGHNETMLDSLNGTITLSP